MSVGKSDIPHRSLMVHISWLIALCVAVVLVPAATLALLKTRIEVLERRMNDFHRASIGATHDAMLALDDLMALSARDPADTPSREVRYAFTQIEGGLRTLLALQRKFDWEESAATVRRIDAAVQPLLQARAQHPPTDDAAIELRALRAAFGQLHRMHDIAANELRHRRDTLNERGWRWVLPIVSVLSIAAVIAARVVWRDIAVGLAAEARLRRQLTENEVRLNQAQRVAQIGSWDLDHTTGRLHWSPEVFRLLELDPAQVTNPRAALEEAVHPDDRAAVNAAYATALRERQSYRISHRLRLASGQIKHVEDRCETDFTAEGAPLRSRGTVQDVTERVRAEETIRRSLDEKETLLREIHHRVKNNLQIISGLLHFQAKKLRDPAAVTVFGEARTRLRSMILVHEKLYRSRDLADVDFSDYVRTLVGHLGSARDARGRSIHFAVSTAPLRLPIESALPAGMILAELVTNVIKYAYPGEQVGGAAVRLTAEGGRVQLAVEDDGPGLPAGFNPHATESFGWKLIANLVAQLDGEFTLVAGPGTRIAISFPQPPARSSA